MVYIFCDVTGPLVGVNAACEDIKKVHRDHCLDALANLS